MPIYQESAISRGSMGLDASGLLSLGQCWGWATRARELETVLMPMILLCPPPKATAWVQLLAGKGAAPLLLLHSHAHPMPKCECSFLQEQSCIRDRLGHGGGEQQVPAPQLMQFPSAGIYTHTAAWEQETGRRSGSTGRALGCMESLAPPLPILPKPPSQHQPSCCSLKLEKSCWTLPLIVDLFFSGRSDKGYSNTELTLAGSS